MVDDSRNYLAHPDSILLKNGNILTMYPAGHGKGAVLNKVSTDGGRSYSSTIANTPASWVNSQETPTVYRLQFTDEQMQDKLIMISANPTGGAARPAASTALSPPMRGKLGRNSKPSTGKGSFRRSSRSLR